MHGLYHMMIVLSLVDLRVRVYPSLAAAPVSSIQ